MHLQKITPSSFTLPTCSDTIPDFTCTSFQGKGERIDAQISCITLRNGGGFCPVAEQSAPQVDDDCRLRYKQIPTLKSGNNFKNVSLARSSDGDILLVHIHKHPCSVLSGDSLQTAFTHHHSIQCFQHYFKKVFFLAFS